MENQLGVVVGTRAIFYSCNRSCFIQTTLTENHLCRYVILPWCMLLSLSLIVLLLLKLVSLKEITSLTLNGISVLIGAPLGLSLAHWVR